MHRTAEKLRDEYTTQIGHRLAPSEVASWQNSLMALSMLVDRRARSNVLVTDLAFSVIMPGIGDDRRMTR